MHLLFIDIDNIDKLGEKLDYILDSRNFKKSNFRH